jgi:hypothetical protein
LPTFDFELRIFAAERAEIFNREGHVMNKLLNGKIDNKNIGLVKNLWQLRQALDVYCLISANANSINQRGAGKVFFGFVQSLCLRFISLEICKIFEDEKKGKRGKVKYELNSIDGVLRAIKDENLAVPDSSRVCGFLEKYGRGHSKEGLLSEILSCVEEFKKNHQKELTEFQTVRDKWIAHSEYEFSWENLPSYDVMEQLFDFAWGFYSAVSETIGVGPCNLDSSRQVRDSMKKILRDLGLKDIETEMR